jgi:hypothetical protein
MSSFMCEKCGKFILDTPKGYISGCAHYPIETAEDTPMKRRSCLNFGKCTIACLDSCKSYIRRNHRTRLNRRRRERDEANRKKA